MIDTTQTHDDAHNPNQETKGDNIWKRGLLMFVFAILFGIAESLLVVMTVIQFLWRAISGAPNVALVDFGAALADWTREVTRFQVMKTDERPFPWGDWPKGD